MLSFLPSLPPGSQGVSLLQHRRPRWHHGRSEVLQDRGPHQRTHVLDQRGRRLENRQILRGTAEGEKSNNILKITSIDTCLCTV